MLACPNLLFFIDFLPSRCFCWLDTIMITWLSAAVIKVKRSRVIFSSSSRETINVIYNYNQPLTKSLRTTVQMG